MDETGSSSRVLSEKSPTGQPGYAVASLVVSGLCVVWMGAIATDLPVDNFKHHRIGRVAAVLALILAYGGQRAANRKRGLTRAAWWAGGMAMLMYVVLRPM